MAAPAPVTGFTITQPEVGRPVLLLEWGHDGVDLHRFEVLYRENEGASWTSYLLALAESFGAGPYSLRVPSAPGFEWVVRALSSDGAVST